MNTFRVIQQNLSRVSAKPKTKNREAQVLRALDPSHKVHWGFLAIPRPLPAIPGHPGDLREVIGGRLYEFDLLWLFVLHMINFV